MLAAELSGTGPGKDPGNGIVDTEAPSATIARPAIF